MHFSMCADDAADLFGAFSEDEKELGGHDSYTASASSGVGPPLLRRGMKRVRIRTPTILACTLPYLCPGIVVSPIHARVGVSPKPSMGLDWGMPSTSRLMRTSVFLIMIRLGGLRSRFLSTLNIRVGCNP